MNAASLSEGSRDPRIRVFHFAHDAPLPLVVESLGEAIPLADWCAENRSWIRTRVLEHGGVLFRNFSVPTPADFERAAQATWGQLFAEYGDLPRTAAGERIYESTPYPPDQMILWHNESAHLGNWPMRINFHCVVAPVTGGCTPIVDTRELIQRLDPDVVDDFRVKGLLYVRNFCAGIEPTWQEFFHTTDRATVERICRDAGSEFQWLPDGGLRIRTRTQGVARHPDTGDELFFNQVQLHHIQSVDAEAREALRELFRDDELPRNVCFGDGSPIPDSVIEHIGREFERASVRFAWRKGDTIFLDNMRVAHGRDPYSGPRKIVVALAQMVTGERVLASQN